MVSYCKYKYACGAICILVVIALSSKLRMSPPSRPAVSVWGDMQSDNALSLRIQQALPEFKTTILKELMAATSSLAGVSSEKQPSGQLTPYLFQHNEAFLDTLEAVRTVRTVRVRESHVRLRRILPPVFYGVNSNDCGTLRGQSSFITPFNLSCSDQLLQKDGVYSRISLDHALNFLSNLTTYVKSTGGVTPYGGHFTSQPPGRDSLLSYVQIIKNGVVNGNGDVATETSGLTIVRCNTAGPLKSMATGKGIPEYEHVVSIAQFWGVGFFHFTIEDLPRLALLLPLFKQETNRSTLYDQLFPSSGAGAKLMVHVAAKNGFTKALLSLLGVPAQRLVSGTVRAKWLLLPAGTRCGHAELVPINLLSYYLRGAHPSRRDTIVLIRRSARRWFDYHDEIHRMLKEVAGRFQLRVAVFADKPVMPLPRARALFWRAVAVVGPHGAGLSNLVLSPPGTCVIEGLCWERPGKLNFCYKDLMQSLGNIYHGVVRREQCMKMRASDLQPHVERCLHYKLHTAPELAPDPSPISKDV